MHIADAERKTPLLILSECWRSTCKPCADPYLDRVLPALQLTRRMHDSPVRGRDSEHTRRILLPQRSFGGVPRLISRFFTTTKPKYPFVPSTFQGRAIFVGSRLSSFSYLDDLLGRASASVTSAVNWYLWIHWGLRRSPVPERTTRVQGRILLVVFAVRLLPLPGH